MIDTHARHAEHARNLEHLFGMVPVRQIGECIAADDEKEFRFGILRQKLLQGQERIALSAAQDLQIARFQPRFAGDCNLHQTKADIGGNAFVHALVRRVGGYHEQNAIQRGFVPRNLGHLHMRAVDGVKRAAKQSDSHVSRPNPSRSFSNAIA
ncbi:hypothetical protein SDC9_100148 [bioreactor metagenome]|uniref:Uncharacterized protein n=1 Tax=bioreactor metagenome TaxID=1076179 RepID=A0A645AM33_9ZZZZ